MAPAQPDMEEEKKELAHSEFVSVPMLCMPVVLKLEDGTTNPLLTAENPISEDSDLTSLSWLQNQNLLQGMKLEPSSGETQASGDEESGVSEGTPTRSPSGQAFRFKAQKHPRNIPYDPLVHLESKPPYSFSCLIFMAIEDSPRRALAVKDIYYWIQKNFPYFKNSRTGWQNSVRHTLSLNKGFQKVENAIHLGKGSLWVVDPLHRPRLLRVMRKSPPSYPRSFRKLEPNPSPVENYQAFDTKCRLPDPELFPYLSRRLAAVDVEGGIRGKRTRPYTEAAAAMLALKQGFQTKAAHSPDYPDPSDDDDEWIPVVITSPDEDHTYNVKHSPALVSVWQTSSPSRPRMTSSKSKEDFITRKQHTSRRSSQSEAEERRKLVEGAEVLLHLAGIATGRNFIINEEDNHYNSSPKRSSVRERARRLVPQEDGHKSHFLHSKIKTKRSCKQDKKFKSPFSANVNNKVLSNIQLQNNKLSKVSGR